MRTVVPPCLRILLSQQALAQWGGAIAHALAGQPHELVTIEQAIACGRAEIDLAFITRDVTGLSTKHELAPALQACYDVLRRSQGLRWVHIHSAGADRDVYVELRARGVAITTSSGANAEVVAQTALAGILALARRFPALMDAQRASRWAPLLGSGLPRDLAGQTVVLLGWGPIGQRLAEFLRVLGLRLTVVRTQPATGPEGIEMVTFAQLADVLPQADWLVLACPLTATTRGLIDARMLARLPAGAQLVNVARGEVVVETDLVAALQAGHLAGAFLDVFEHEPLPSASPLWALPNVMVTPHTAGHSDGHAARVATLFVDNLARWLNGQALRNAVP